MPWNSGPRVSLIVLISCIVTLLVTGIVLELRTRELEELVAALACSVGAVDCEDPAFEENLLTNQKQIQSDD